MWRSNIDLANKNTGIHFSTGYALTKFNIINSTLITIRNLGTPQDLATSWPKLRWISGAQKFVFPRNRLKDKSNYRLLKPTMQLWHCSFSAHTYCLVNYSRELINLVTFDTQTQTHKPQESTRFFRNKLQHDVNSDQK